MGGFPSGQRGQTVNLLQIASVVRIHLHPLAVRRQLNIAGWSSLEARRAHNPKVIGSNPVPATYAQIAQLVEQRTENPRVAGSIPAGTTIRMMQVYPSPAEGIGLENRQRINVLRGFESLNLRH